MSDPNNQNFDKAQRDWREDDRFNPPRRRPQCYEDRPNKEYAEREWAGDPEPREKDV